MKASLSCVASSLVIISYLWMLPSAERVHWVYSGFWARGKGFFRGSPRGSLVLANEHTWIEQEEDAEAAGCLHFSQSEAKIWRSCACAVVLQRFFLFWAEKNQHSLLASQTGPRSMACITDIGHALKSSTLGGINFIRWFCFSEISGVIGIYEYWNIKN